MSAMAAGELKWTGGTLWYGGLYVGCVIHAVHSSPAWCAWAMVEKDGAEVAWYDTREEAMRAVENAVMAVLPSAPQAADVSRERTSADDLVKSLRALGGWPINDAADTIERLVASLKPFGQQAKRATRVQSGEWEGWRYGTQSLKPAIEPIYVGQKPFSEKTGTANVLRWGTGAINVDGCRIAAPDEIKPRGSSKLDTDMNDGWARPWMEDRGEVQRRHDAAIERANSLGRWPANVVHDGSAEVIEVFPTVGNSHPPGNEGSIRTNNVFGEDKAPRAFHQGFSDRGSAARFFFSAKADAHDRIGSKHPTVKPIDLMQWICRLITPPGGTVLDCFAGTGTTAEAAYREGYNAVLIEREPEYQADIRRRIALVLAGPDERNRESIKARNIVADAGPLFGDHEEGADGGNIRRSRRTIGPIGLKR